SSWEIGRDLSTFFLSYLNACWPTIGQQASDCPYVFVEGNLVRRLGVRARTNPQNILREFDRGALIWNASLREELLFAEWAITNGCGFSLPVSSMQRHLLGNDI